MPMLRFTIGVIFAWSIICLMNALIGAREQVKLEDDDFAEFDEVFEKSSDSGSNIDQEEFELDSKVEKEDSKPSTAKPALRPVRTSGEQDESDEAVVEEEDSEFDNFADDEEFEGQDNQQTSKRKADSVDLKIAKVPVHFRASWDSFHLEMMMLAGLFLYFVNFIIGRNKNQNLVDLWFKVHKPMMEQNFAVVGDDGRTTDNSENPGLLKESENMYILWCSGRAYCEGILIELRLLKRQDLLHCAMQLVKPQTDQIVIKITMNNNDMDNFVFLLANKKTAAKMSKEMQDLITYCKEKKNMDKFGLPASFTLMSEIGEVSNALLDSRVIALCNKFENYIDHIHISDQFSGPKVTEESQPTKLPDVKKVILIAFNLPPKAKLNTCEEMESIKPLMQIVFHLLDKVKRFKLSKEAKVKSDKNRASVEEQFMKATHSQRQEAAQLKREERRRQEKERILAEDDPDKQRKWEEKEHKREMKRRAPKMKQLRVKSM